MSSENTNLAWMPVTEDMKPNDGVGNAVMSYKEKYSSMKLQLKKILYENELYNAELVMLKRELIDIYSDKDTLLRRIVESGVDLGTSDDNDSDSQLSDSLKPAKCNDNNMTNTASSTINGDSTSRIAKISIPEIASTATKTITATTTTTATQAQVMTIATTQSTTNLSAVATTENRAKPKTTTSKPRAKPRPAASKAANNKTTPVVGETTNSNTDSKPIQAVNNGNGQTGKACSTAKATNSGGPAKPAAAKRKKPQQVTEPQQKQQPQAQQISEQKILPNLEQSANKGPIKPPAPKRQRKQPQKKPAQQKKSTDLQQTHQPQQQPQQPQHQQQQQGQPQQQAQQQQQQQQPMTMIGQVQVSLPSDQMKYVQHVNLPEKNLAATNNLIVTNHNSNAIQIYPSHDDNNQQHHQIHFQLPQTTISNMESFQTPQSIITTSQGGHLGYGQHQSYTIVATNSNGNLIHHDLNQHHTNSPPVQITQLLPMNQTITQHVPSQAIQSQGMTQDLNTIGFQQIQASHATDQHQQHRQDETTYEHQIVHFELPQIQLPQQQTHIQHNNHRIHLQQTQQVQTQRLQPTQPQSQQNDSIATDDLEQHLDTRRLEQAPLLPSMSDWESSLPSELFGSDSAIKFMAED